VVSESGWRPGHDPWELQSRADAQQTEQRAEHHVRDDVPTAAEQRSLRAWLPLLVILAGAFVLLLLSLPRWIMPRRARVLLSAGASPSAPSPDATLPDATLARRRARPWPGATLARRRDRTSTTVVSPGPTAAGWGTMASLGGRRLAPPTLPRHAEKVCQATNAGNGRPADLQRMPPRHETRSRRRRGPLRCAEPAPFRPA